MATVAEAPARKMSCMSAGMVYGLWFSISRCVLIRRENACDFPERIKTIWRLAGPGYQWGLRVRERHWNIETVPATFQRHLPTRSPGKRDSGRDPRKSADPHIPHLVGNSTL